MIDVMDHDQRFKVLLTEFFSEFFQLFFLTWWERFDFTRVEWLQQEMFTDPPQGERRILDLVAKLPTRPGVPGQRPGEAESWIALVHVEIESRDSVQPVRLRMYETYEHLRRTHRCPVLPIGVYLRVGLDGLGVDVYQEHFWEFRTIHFQYLYVGLPALDGLEYLTRDNWLGVALTALMRIPEDRKAWLRAEAERRIMQSAENNFRKLLLNDCLQAYAVLNEFQAREYQSLIQTSPFREAHAMQIGIVEEKVAERLEDYLKRGFQQALQMQLEERFGPLKPLVIERLQALSVEQIQGMFRPLVKAHSLKELGLEE